MLQFDYDKFGMQTSTLNKQLALYNALGAGLGQLGGNVHDWSFTLNPIANFYSSDTFGAYAVAGVGFYHKYTEFTTPSIGTYCDPFLMAATNIRRMRRWIGTRVMRWGSMAELG